MTDYGNCRRRTQPLPRHISRPALLAAGSLLFCAHPASAQTVTVNSGSATVSGAGTAVVGAGTTFGGGASAATTTYASGEAIGDGSNDAFSTLNLQTGGSIQNLTAASDGLVNVTGGSAGFVTTDNSGVINISGGTVQTASAGFFDGHLTISGGKVQNADSGTGASSVMNSLTITGGTIGAVTIDRAGVDITGGTIGSVNSDGSFFTGGISVGRANIQNINTAGDVSIGNATVNTVTGNNVSIGGNATVNTVYASTAQVDGGTIQALTIGANGGPDSDISGGKITNLTFESAGAYLGISGGQFQFINATHIANVINITGTDLKELGTPTDAFGAGVFHLLGTLTDGEALNAQYQSSGTASAELEFNGVPAVPMPVPEASTCVSLALLLLLGGAGLTFRAYKRRAV